MSNRSIVIPGVWANGAPDVPTTPATGTTYRDSVIATQDVIDALKYNTIADSSKLNEILYRLTSLMLMLEQYGTLPFCPTTTYSLGATCMGSDGIMYRSKAGGNYGHDPVNDTSNTYWITNVKDLNPIGTILPIAHTNIPTGYLECNGVAISRTTYSNLFSLVGTVWGAGDGSTTFNLPDFRGKFMRGYDHGRAIDVGRVFGAPQTDAIQNITGSFGIDGRTRVATTPVGVFYYDNDNYANTGPGDIGDGSTAHFDASRVVRTATETRPTNETVVYVIKY